MKQNSRVLIGLNGAYGRMCQALSKAANDCDKYEIAFGVDNKARDDLRQNYPVFCNFENVPKCDVIVDFSTHTATKSALDFALENALPIVVATTGHTAEERRAIIAAGKRIPVFFAGNTSFGVYVTTLLAKTAAELLDFDVEIVETHHRIKTDAPSGTALALANAIADVKREKLGRDFDIVYGRAGRREQGEIGVHSLRGGTVVGKHEIVFLGDDERLTITHEAENKNVYVHGVFRAIDFLLTQPPAVYGMNDLIKNGT